MKRHLMQFILVAASMFTVSCSESIINVINYPPSDNGGGQTGTSLVTFYASVESRNVTKSMAPINKNIKADIYVYPSANNTTFGTPASMGTYISPSPGILQGVDDFKMYLPAGVYDFFGVSDNTQFQGPKFINGLSEALINGIDYLWWGGLKQDVKSEQVGVPVVFTHSSTQLIFEVREGAGITISQLTGVHIYPPLEGAQMNIATGIIPPAAAYSTKEIKMTLNGMHALYTFLPIETAQPVKVYFDVILDGEAAPRTYEVDMPLPDGVLKSGNSYHFLAIINGNSVSFPEVSVRDWVTVDETGKPLYPSEL